MPVSALVLASWGAASALRNEMKYGQLHYMWSTRYSSWQGITCMLVTTNAMGRDNTRRWVDVDLFMGTDRASTLYEWTKGSWQGSLAGETVGLCPILEGGDSAYYSNQSLSTARRSCCAGTTGGKDSLTSKEILSWLQHLYYRSDNVGSLVSRYRMFCVLVYWVSGHQNIFTLIALGVQNEKFHLPASNLRTKKIDIPGPFFEQTCANIKLFFQSLEATSTAIIEYHFLSFCNSEGPCAMSPKNQMSS
ncbi:hypothetical protein V8B97DRAFT_1920515 [Scleroderma yunnanense]